jgi:asparagine synthase (glutamine-hydrolysing)
MCGINGALVFRNSNFNITENYINNMSNVMFHRGPDGSGTWISKDMKIGLGHRRLSIIDTSTLANQPMLNLTENIIIVFNGEIYNHAEIKVELSLLNKYTWKTDHSDTEVILHAYEEWGIDCIHKFRGMFAIAIWDENIEKLWLIRDRIGIKPLYYSLFDSKIVFASEIKSILTDKNQPKQLNEQGFFDYLSFLTIPAPYTMFKDIFKLECGTYLSIDKDGTIYKKKYWDVLDNIDSSIENKSQIEIEENILRELRHSVNLRKVSDVPVGVFLSGGIDSSTNTILFSEDTKELVKTFTIGYNGDYNSYTNELIYANKIAKLTNSEHYEKILNINDFISFLDKMVYLQDEPLGDSVCVPLYYLSKTARDNGVIVCQLGEGADELFWGYAGWKRILNFQFFCDKFLPRILKKLILLIFSATGIKNSWKYEYLKRSFDGVPIFWGGAEAFTHNEKIQILSNKLKNKYKNNTSWNSIKSIRESYEDKSNKLRGLNWMSYIDLNFRLPELLLMRVDKMSMGVSLECRVPFLDHKFVEFVMSIPEKLKTKNNESKYLLKSAIRGLVPNEIIDRKKQGFAAPIEDWFKQELGGSATIIIKDFCQNSDLLDWEEISILIQKNHSSKLWPILNVALWWNNNFKNQ